MKKRAITERSVSGGMNLKNGPGYCTPTARNIEVYVSIAN